MYVEWGKAGKGVYPLQNNSNPPINLWNIFPNFPSSFHAEKSRMLYSITCSMTLFGQGLDFQLSSSATGQSTSRQKMNLTEQDENHREKPPYGANKIFVQRIYNSFTNEQRCRIISVQPPVWRSWTEWFCLRHSWPLRHTLLHILLYSNKYH